MKSNSYYFSHDYNAANDTKILFLRHQLGMEGYGIYWFLIEQLANAGGRLPLELIPVLTMQMQSTDVKVNGVIHNFELFKIEQGEFYSERLEDHLQLRLKLSESGKNGANNRWKNGGANRGAIGEGNAKKRKEKENKENKIKLNEYNIPFEEWWFKYDKKTGKEKSLIKWNLLNKEEKELALSVVEQYVDSTPDKKYRKDPATYLHNKSFNDEIIKPTSTTKLSYAEREWERLKNL